MKAEVQQWKLWGAEKDYPVLVLQCSSAELEATAALHRLNKICAGLRGLGYNHTLAAISNPDAIKDQGTVFAIDLGTLLTLLAEVEGNKSSSEFAVGWLRSLTTKIKETEQKRLDEFICRCGQAFKNDRKLKHHQKLCTIIARDFGLILRAQESLKNLTKKGKDDGDKTSKSKSKIKRIRKDNEAPKIRSKVSKRRRTKR